MPRKVMLITDPGVDGAFAGALALNAGELEVVGLAASAGNVPAEQATRNVHILVEQLDPPRWPRLGAALPVDYDVDARALHGANGLGSVEFPCVQLHHPHPADKLLSDLVRQHPKEIAVLLFGPATVFARALDRDPELAELVERIVMVGGAWREPGDATAAAEFHFYCDPVSARQVLRCGAPITLLPLDVTRKAVFSPTELLHLPRPQSPATRFLARIVPPAIAASAGLYGVEGCYLQDVFGLVALVQPQAFKTWLVPVDVETRGDLTRGAMVCDVRWGTTAKPNVDLVVDVEMGVVRQFIQRTLSRE
ncbi:MAG TPA: nucleoside hydrolase [Gemmataceae bacterium]|nr:nucleoside hydrolase [Gemmataceae bacterium]